jgi:hypothetical protein
MSLDQKIALGGFCISMVLIALLILAFFFVG